MFGPYLFQVLLTDDAKEELRELDDSDDEDSDTESDFDNDDDDESDDEDDDWAAGSLRGQLTHFCIKAKSATFELLGIISLPNKYNNLSTLKQ